MRESVIGTVGLIETTLWGGGSNPSVLRVSGERGRSRLRPAPGGRGGSWEIWLPTPVRPGGFESGCGRTGGVAAAVCGERGRSSKGRGDAGQANCSPVVHHCTTKREWRGNMYVVYVVPSSLKAAERWLLVGRWCVRARSADGVTCPSAGPLFVVPGTATPCRGVAVVKC